MPIAYKIPEIPRFQAYKITSFHLCFHFGPSPRGAAVGGGVGAAAQGGRAARAAVHPNSAALGQRGWRPGTQRGPGGPGLDGEIHHGSVMDSPKRRGFFGEENAESGK